MYKQKIFFKYFLVKYCFIIFSVIEDDFIIKSCKKELPIIDKPRSNSINSILNYKSFTIDKPRSNSITSILSYIIDPLNYNDLVITVCKLIQALEKNKNIITLLHFMSILKDNLYKNIKFIYYENFKKDVESQVYPYHYGNDNNKVYKRYYIHFLNYCYYYHVKMYKGLKTTEENKNKHYNFSKLIEKQLNTFISKKSLTLDCVNKTHIN